MSINNICITLYVSVAGFFYYLNVKRFEDVKNILSVNEIVEFLLFPVFFTKKNIKRSLFLNSLHSVKYASILTVCYVKDCHLI